MHTAAMASAVKRARPTGHPRFIKKPESQPPPMLPKSAATNGTIVSQAASLGVMLRSLTRYVGSQVR
jgi:hypothetical protein